ncbi:C-terminal helicase domain-containing protein [Abditibacterium utsteinense]|uniref:C-terminal helicase domain-containing protein n=1 Tax=Abditibacterium utsteinense TaxID=1960156 RepID=UPI0013008C00|nr:helicase-related protein [Abditibacterium utsteinense]
MSQDEEIDVLIATDCISEGQNLQDAACVVNYDIHWNPVRLIQRFGRVDRLGSQHESIQMVNFWPAIGLETYIKLKTRVEGRMAMVQLAATADDEDWRGGQLQKLHNEIPDPDDKPGLSLSEVSTEDFLADLAAYLETNRAALEAAPPGLFAVIPQSPSHGISRGVVWCLRQKNAAEVEKRRLKRRDGSRFAPPHFLVYVGQDLQIKIAHTQDRKLLGILRELCAGQISAFEELCDEFEKSRDYETLKVWVETAIASCCENEKKVSLGALMQRGGLIPAQSQQAQMDLDEWEIVTWFVVR